MPLTRRELCSVFPVALLPALLSVEDPSARQSSLPSTMYAFENLPVRTANNAQFRDVLKGRLATGETLEVHETTLPPGDAPHPPHHHVHSEMWLIREGTVELAVSGKTYRSSVVVILTLTVSLSWAKNLLDCSTGSFPWRYHEHDQFVQTISLC